MAIKPIVIGDLIAKVPIVQGGMGIGVSLSGLAGAVAAEGGIGVISSAQIGYLEPDFENNPLEANLRALGKHIQKAREIAQGGIIAVNIMVATKNYEKYVLEAVKDKIDIIISGAGLPVTLPQLVKGSGTKIAPIISSLKAASVIFKLWDRKHNIAPDMVIYEGPKAGGHLGFNEDELLNIDNIDVDKEIKDVKAEIELYEKKYNKKIPLIVAGGVFDSQDVSHYLELGADGVQVATPFVATEECDAHDNYKQAYINAKKEDIGIVKSPVGMPGRAIVNSFIRSTKNGKLSISKCYSCIQGCKPAEIPYCITKALINAVKGNVDEGLLFCGENAYKVSKITTVKEVIEGLVKDL